MNERIKELIKQAADQTSAAFSSSNFRQSEWESDFREKFAELLIKETLQVARVGFEYGPSMDEVVYKYFGIKS